MQLPHWKKKKSINKAIIYLKCTRTSINYDIKIIATSYGIVELFVAFLFINIMVENKKFVELEHKIRLNVNGAYFKSNVILHCCKDNGIKLRLLHKIYYVSLDGWMDGWKEASKFDGKRHTSSIHNKNHQFTYFYCKENISDIRWVCMRIFSTVYYAQNCFVAFVVFVVVVCDEVRCYTPQMLN